MMSYCAQNVILVVLQFSFSRYLGFVGCISDFDVNNNKAWFDLTKPDEIRPGRSSRSCYSVAQPGIGFNGSAWARFGKLTTAYIREFAVAVATR